MKGKFSVKAFTLVELLVAMAVLSVLAVFLSLLLGGVSRAWTSGEQQVESFQNGRAILDLMTREVAQAAISPRLQLIQNPVLPSGAGQRANSDSLFWQAPLSTTASGSLSEIGYFLNDAYELKRFFVPPTSPDYAIYSNPPTATAAPWLTTPFPSITEFDAVTSTISRGVLAVWIRCIGVNGVAVPWFNIRSPEAPSGSRIRYNSAGRFQPAIAAQTPPPGSSSWPYTASTTVQAHRLPKGIEITVVTLDRRTLQRNPAIPSIPASADPDQIRGAIGTFNDQLVAAGVSTARTFTTQVNLANGSP